MSMPEFREDGWLPEGHHPATWDEIESVFGGETGSRRALLTKQLLTLRDGLRICKIFGTILLDGSYISAKKEPGDFDVLLIGPADIQVRKENLPELSQWLDAEIAEKEKGYSLFYIPNDSPVIDMLKGFWDLSKEGVPKGIVEVVL